MNLDDKIAVWIQHGGGAEETEDERGPHGRHHVPLVRGGVQGVRDGAPGVRQRLPQHPEPEGGHQVRGGARPVLLPLEEDGATRCIRKLLPHWEEEVHPSPGNHRLHGEVSLKDHCYVCRCIRHCFKVHGRAGCCPGPVRQPKLSFTHLRCRRFQAEEWVQDRRFQWSGQKWLSTRPGLRRRHLDGIINILRTKWQFIGIASLSSESEFKP